MTTTPAHAALRACVADSPMPPFARLDAAGRVPQRLPGVGIELLQLALQRIGQPPAEITPLPMLRCLKAAAAGELDLVLNIPTAQIDPGPFLISASYYTLHSIYFTSLQRHPGGLPIRNLEDLKRLQVCGLAGYRFDTYGIRNDSVDVGSKDYRSLVKKLHAGRCDLFIEKREIVAGLYLDDLELARMLFAGDMAHEPLPEDAPVELHYVISRQSPVGSAVYERLNRQILDLQKHGDIEKLMLRYIDSTK